MKLKFAILGLFLLSAFYASASTRKTGEQNPIDVESLRSCAPCQARFVGMYGKAALDNLLGNTPRSEGKAKGGTAESSENRSEKK